MIETNMLRISVLEGRELVQYLEPVYFMPSRAIRFEIHFRRPKMG